jgi:hypothetical protein
VANTNRDLINSAMGGSQDPNQDDYQSAMGGVQSGFGAGVLMFSDGSALQFSDGQYLEFAA